MLSHHPGHGLNFPKVAKHKRGVVARVEKAGAIKKGLSKLPTIPGRMEVIEGNQPFTVIVDYAHTPDAFQKIFENLRNKNSIIFELGVGTNNTSIPYNMGTNGFPGASLRGWSEYFGNAEIYGADIDENILFNDDKIKTYYCDQKNSQSIKQLWENFTGKKFDVIIDDGVHEFDTNILFLEKTA